jgi:hypothetical protein
MVYICLSNLLRYSPTGAVLSLFVIGSRLTHSDVAVANRAGRERAFLLMNIASMVLVWCFLRR